MIEAKFDERQAANLLKRLKTLPDKMQRKILRQEAKRAGERFLLSAARRATPMRTGKLRSSVDLHPKRTKTSVGVRVGLSAKAFTGDTFYGSFLEYGWTPKQKRNVTLSSLVGLTSDRRKVKPKYYLKKVADSRGPAALSSFSSHVAERIDKELQSWQT